MKKLLLILSLLVPVKLIAAPGVTPFDACVQNSLAQAAEINSRFVPKPIFDKYNAPSIYKFELDKGTLKKFKEHYHNGEVPSFVHGFAHNKDSGINFVKWSPDQSTVLVFNSPYYKKNFLHTKMKEGKLETIKNSDEGLILTTWFMHPKLKETPLGTKIKISDIEKSGDKFLTSILDLTPSEIPHLKMLKKMAEENLKKDFGVKSTDKVRLYFHFPIADASVGLHLHVRVNNPTHGLESSRSYDLDEIIKYLEQKKSIDDLILNRQKKNGGLYTGPGEVKNIVESFGSIEVKPATNPFRDPKIDVYPE